MAVYRPGQGLAKDTVKRLHDRKCVDAGIADVPAEDANEQWDKILGGPGAKKKLRCGNCTRPLSEAALPKCACCARKRPSNDAKLALCACSRGSGVTQRGENEKRRKRERAEKEKGARRKEGLFLEKYERVRKTEKGSENQTERGDYYFCWACGGQKDMLRSSRTVERPQTINSHTTWAPWEETVVGLRWCGDDVFLRARAFDCGVLLFSHLFSVLGESLC